MLRAVMDKVDSIEEQMSNASRETAILRKLLCYVSFLLSRAMESKKEMNQLWAMFSFPNVAESSSSLHGRILTAIHSFNKYYGALVIRSALCLEAGDARMNMILLRKVS